MASPRNRVRGEKHGSAKLNKATADKIRSMYNKGNISQRDLAKIFEISADTVNKIVNNKRWT